MNDVGNPLALGIDVGGTKIASVLVDRKGNIHAEHRLPTLVDDGVTAVVGRILESIRYLESQAKQPIVGVGIGCPGYIDSANGIVHKAVNLYWEDVPLVDMLKTHVISNWPIWLQHDAAAAALGEMYYGAAYGSKDFVLIAIGTGLGGAAVTDGDVLEGARGFAMEIGHISLDVHGRMCNCGLRGCTERYISGLGLLASLEEFRSHFPDSLLAQMIDATTQDILNAYQRHDALAIAILDEAARWLGATLGICVGMLNPELFVIGGGMGLALHDLILPKIEVELHQRTLPILQKDLRLVKSQVTHSAIGAASLVWHQLR